MSADNARMIGAPGYQLVRWIGASAVATVYVARHVSDGARVAVKVFHPLEGPELDRLEQLLQINARLAHPNIVRIGATGRTEDGRLFVTMPLLLGFERARRDVAGRPLRIAAMLREVLDGLGHAHRDGVVHGGIKPANVLFDEQGRAQLADFGLAQWSAEQGLPHPDALAWLSPEQMRGGAADPRSDVYSVGVLAYELLTGTLPWAGAAASAPAGVELVQRVPQLPPRAGAWQPWIDRALAVAPAQRFAGADAMAAGLGAIVGYGGYGAADASGETPARRSRRNLVAIVAALAIVVLAAWALWSPRQATFVGAYDNSAVAPAESPAPPATAALPLAALPAPAATVSPLAERVQGLVAAADALRARGRVFSPPVHNAASQYLAALALDPGNRGALVGVGATLAIAGKQLEQAWGDHKLDAALAVLKQGDSLAAHAGPSARRAWRKQRDGLAAEVGDAVVQAAHAHDPARVAALQPLAEALPATWPSGFDFASAERLAATPLAGEHLRDPGGPLMVYVPAWGKLPAFAIEQVEVTRANYARFAAATHRPAAKCLEAHNPFSRLRHLTWKAPGFPQAGDHPVVCVSWNDATAYAAWLSKSTGQTYHLPGSGEWMRAAHGMPKDNPCTLGNVDDASRKTTFDNDRWSCDDGAAQTAPVGHYAASGVGAYDMYGNVSEWLAGGSPGSRPFRGLSWRDGSHETPLGAHGTADSDVGYTSVGFRVVRVIEAGHPPPPAR